MLIQNKVIYIYKKNSPFSFNEVFLSAVEKKLKSLKHKKARTFENIHPIILKKSRECYSDILQKHFHNTFSNKEFLDELKLADVTSIYTKVHPNKSIIYHPIGVLLVVS